MKGVLPYFAWLIRVIICIPYYWHAFVCIAFSMDYHMRWRQKRYWFSVAKPIYLSFYLIWTLRDSITNSLMKIGILLMNVPFMVDFSFEEIFTLKFFDFLVLKEVLLLLSLKVFLGFYLNSIRWYIPTVCKLNSEFNFYYICSWVVEDLRNVLRRLQAVIEAISRPFTFLSHMHCTIP